MNPSELKRRGWTAGLIKTLLGEKRPDGTYHRERVRHAERTPEFKRQLEALQKEVIEGEVPPINDPGPELRLVLAEGKKRTEEQDTLLVGWGGTVMSAAARILDYRYHHPL